MNSHLRHPQPHLPPSSSAFNLQQTKKSRGSYNCSRCGLPKKGHICQLSPATPTSSAASDSFSSFSAVRPPPLPPPPPSNSRLRRALSFDDCSDEAAVRLDPDTEDDLDPENADGGGLPAVCLWEVMRRLPPAELMAAARVCKGWRETTRRIWRAAEELRLRVPARAQVGYVSSLLQKCPGLVRLSLQMERLIL